MRVAKEVELDISGLAVALQGLDYARRGQPLVNEKGECGDVKRETFRLARPVEEWFPKGGELLYGVLEAANRGPDSPIVELQLSRGVKDMRRIELCRFLDTAQQKLRKITGAVLSVPFQRWRERRVVPLGDGGLFLLELRLRPYLRA